MRKLIRLSVVLLVAAVLAACAPVDGEVAGTGALESGDGYPPSLAPTPDAYPAAPESATQPTGYPELTTAIPSGEVDLDDLTPVTPESTTPEVMPFPGRPDATVSPRLGVMLEAIIRDLSAQSDVPADEIRFVSAMPTVWPNSGLGCPAQGVAYAEVETEGMVITLQAGNKTYTYHTDGGRNFALCVDGRPVSSGVVPRR